MSSSIRLDGKVAIVTGAAQGIGRAIALDLAARGAVAVEHRTEDLDRARPVRAQNRTTEPPVVTFDSTDPGNQRPGNLTARLVGRHCPRRGAVGGQGRDGNAVRRQR